MSRVGRTVTGTLTLIDNLIEQNSGVSADCTHDERSLSKTTSFGVKEEEMQLSRALR